MDADQQKSSRQADPSPDPTEIAASKSQLVNLVRDVPELNAELAEAYQEVVTTGDSLDERKNLIKRAAVLDQLKEFGRLHKLRLKKNPNDEVAKACQEQIITLAIAGLKPKAAADLAVKTDKSKQAVIITLSLLITVAAIAWMFHQGLL